MIDDVQRYYNIDRHRIYATGMSAGGGMASVSACHMADSLTPYNGGSRWGTPILPVSAPFASYERRDGCTGRSRPHPARQQRHPRLRARLPQGRRKALGLSTPFFNAVA